MAARSRVPRARSLMSAIRLATRPGSPGLSERFAALPRLFAAARAGHYRGVTMRRLGMMAAALAYIVSPVDFMPEALLGVFGLADDAMVLSWLSAALINETESFLAWEKGATRPADGASWPQPAPHPQTVPGSVIR